MGFLQPLALLGLMAAAIPPLLHLLGRRRPPTVVFPAIQYLSATEREHSRRLKLRQFLLLLLRMAVIVLVVLAAARPVLRAGSGASHPPTAIALVVDNSLSSGAVHGGDRVLDVLVQRARQVLDRADAGDQIWLVLADGVPRRMVREAATSLLDSLAPWPVRLDLGDAVRAAGRALQQVPLTAREVIVVSDLQASALAMGEPVMVRTLVHQPPPVPANVGVDSGAASPVVWSPAGSVIAGVGGDEAGPVAVRLVVAGNEVARAVASPGGTVVLAGQGRGNGWAVASVELEPDELRADDRRVLALFVARPAAVQDAPASGRFLRQALAVLRDAGRIGRGNEVRLGEIPGRGTWVIFPPSDPALIGATNRALAAHRVGWRLGERLEGEWRIEGQMPALTGITVTRRHRLEGSGTVLARAGGEPWLVRSGDVVVMASRMEEDWSELPVSAAFVPFLDFLLNRVAARESWIVRATPGETVVLPPVARSVLFSGGPVAVSSDGRVSVPLEPGVYFLGGSSGDTVGALEVNHDPRESRLASARAAEVRAALGPEARVLGAAAFAREIFGGAGRVELTGLLLVAALVAALAELAVSSLGSGRRPG